MRRILGFSSVLVILIACLAVLTLAKPVQAAKTNSTGSNLVMLTASWCGTCREIGPVVQRIASSNGYGFVSIDVDAPDAPNSAGQYGVSLSGADLPQVYLSNNGKTTLLFNGKGYRFGQSKVVEGLMRQQLGN